MQYGVREKISQSWSTVVVSASNFVYEPVTQFNYLFDVCLDKELCFETKEELLENIKSYLDTKEVSKFYMTTANYIYKK